MSKSILSFLNIDLSQPWDLPVKWWFTMPRYPQTALSSGWGPPPTPPHCKPTVKIWKGTFRMYFLPFFRYLTVICFLKCSSFIWSFVLIFCDFYVKCSWGFKGFQRVSGQKTYFWPSLLWGYKAIFSVCCLKLVHFSHSSVFWEFFLFHHRLVTCWFDGWWSLFT